MELEKISNTAGFLRPKQGDKRIAHSLIGAATLHRNLQARDENEDRARIFTPTDRLGTWVLYNNTNFNLFNHNFEGDVDDADLNVKPDRSKF